MNTNEVIKDVSDNYNKLISSVNDYRLLAITTYNTSLSVIKQSSNQDKILNCYNIINKDLNVLNNELNNINNEFINKCKNINTVDTYINSIKCLSHLMETYEKYEGIITHQINDLKILINEVTQEENNG